MQYKLQAIGNKLNYLKSNFFPKKRQNKLKYKPQSGRSYLQTYNWQRITVWNYYKSVRKKTEKL